MKFLRLKNLYYVLILSSALLLSLASCSQSDGRAANDEPLKEQASSEGGANIDKDKKTVSDLIENSELQTSEVEKKPYFILNSSRVTQGGVFEIRSYNPSGSAPSIIGNIPNLSDFIAQGEGYYIALIPTDYLSEAGIYEVTCSYENGEERSFKLEIIKRDFHTQYLTIDEDIVEETSTEAAFMEFNQHYYAAISADSYMPESKSLSEMNFIMPTVGVITTTYGEERYVNGAATNVYHRGVDIAGDLGDEIYAAADGRVNLAKNLTSSGNTIIISHGYGIFTSYFHLNELAVKQGDFVKKGQLIGYQGTTGFSTGVHLHFELSVRDTTLEPGYYIFGGEIDYE